MELEATLDYGSSSIRLLACCTQAGGPLGSETPRMGPVALKSHQSAQPHYSHASSADPAPDSLRRSQSSNASQSGGVRRSLKYEEAGGAAGSHQQGE